MPRSLRIKCSQCEGSGYNWTASNHRHEPCSVCRGSGLARHEETPAAMAYLAGASSMEGLQRRLDLLISRADQKGHASHQEDDLEKANLYAVEAAAWAAALEAVTQVMSRPASGGGRPPLPTGAVLFHGM